MNRLNFMSTAFSPATETVGLHAEHKSSTVPKAPSHAQVHINADREQEERLAENQRYVEQTRRLIHNNIDRNSTMKLKNYDAPWSGQS